MSAVKITDVFTPRSANVNLKIYVPRLDQERTLIRSVQGSMHSLIFGESGNGKSWMYKKVLDEYNIPYRVANCANASRNASICQEIVSVLIPPGTAQKTGQTETKEAAVKAVVAEGKLNHQDQYSISDLEPLERAFAHFRKSHETTPIVIVLDNLESIFDSTDLMGELADIIILLDDERYAKYKIKFIVVGVPNGVLEYFARTKNLESVANRIEELPKIVGLTLPMVTTLVTTGFNKLLNYNLSTQNLTLIAKHVHDVTMGVAQCVHEYCEKLAYQLETNRDNFSPDLLKDADLDWLRMGLRQGYTVIEAHLNSKRTSVSRRNQVIYCIGKNNVHQIDSNRIKDLIKEHFSETVPDTNMGVGSILAELASGESPLLKRNPRTNDYRIINPRYVMCIRAMLKKDPTSGSVIKLHFAL
jgi:hypothetical protein